MEPNETTPKVKMCPFCGSLSLYLEVAIWKATSSEDPKNNSELPENQCEDCGMSFWC